MKRTDWYPGTVKPVRVGYYEVLSTNSDPRFQIEWIDYFDGKFWRDCKGGTVFHPMVQDKHQWRGLTEKAK